MTKQEFKKLKKLKKRAGRNMLDILEFKHIFGWEKHENLHFRSHYDCANYYLDAAYYHLFKMVNECQEKNTEQVEGNADSV